MPAKKTQPINEEGQFMNVPVKLVKKEKKVKVADPVTHESKEIPVISHTEAIKRLPKLKIKKEKTEKQQAVLEKMLAGNKKRFEERKAMREQERKAIKESEEETELVIVKPKTKYIKSQNIDRESKASKKEPLLQSPKTQSKKTKMLSKKKIPVQQSDDTDEEDESSTEYMTETEPPSAPPSPPPPQHKRRVKVSDKLHQLEQKQNLLLSKFTPPPPPPPVHNPILEALLLRRN